MTFAAPSSRLKGHDLRAFQCAKQGADGNGIAGTVLMLGNARIPDRLKQRMPNIRRTTSWRGNLRITQ